MTASELGFQKSSQTYAGMRNPKSRSRISGFCFDRSDWAPEGPPSRVSNFKDPQRSERIGHGAIVFGNRAGPAEMKEGRLRLISWELYCIIMYITDVCL